MHRSVRLSLSLTGAAAFALASSPIQPVAAQEDDGSADDLGVMEINLKDAVQFNWGFQGALQGAGTPNQAGIGAFLPIAVGENSVFFIDALANVNFSDYDNYSSIINTEVAGTTISTSTRLGYRWLNGDRSWMYGVNAGYDSRPMNTSCCKKACFTCPYANSTTYKTKKGGGDQNFVFFKQIAAGLEAVSDSWNFNAYGLFPIGDTEQRLNSYYNGSALRTYGLDVGYSITPDLNASVGYYYQQGDLDDADGSGVKGRLAYNISNGLTLGANLSYDEAFNTSFTADIKYRFGSNGYGAPSSKKKWKTPAIEALSTTPPSRDVRVHDGKAPKGCDKGFYYGCE